jgi:hypothetical protein
VLDESVCGSGEVDVIVVVTVVIVVVDDGDAVVAMCW